MYYHFRKTNLKISTTRQLLRHGRVVCATELHTKCDNM